MSLLYIYIYICTPIYIYVGYDVLVYTIYPCYIILLSGAPQDQGELPNPDVTDAVGRVVLAAKDEYC